MTRTVETFVPDKASRYFSFAVFSKGLSGLSDISQVSRCGSGATMFKHSSLRGATGCSTTANVIVCVSEVLARNKAHEALREWGRKQDFPLSMHLGSTSSSKEIEIV